VQWGQFSTASSWHSVQTTPHTNANFFYSLPVISLGPLALIRKEVWTIFTQKDTRTST
jgi:hypothetical protein